MNTKEQQDKLWNDLSIESRKVILNRAKNLRYSVDICANGQGLEDSTRLSEYMNMFGEHNLFPQPIPKTWKDIESLGSHIQVSKGKMGIDLSIPKHLDDNLMIDKLVATIKIYNLIKTGYGGLVDYDYLIHNPAWTIVAKLIDFDGSLELSIEPSHTKYELLSFKSEKLAKEFLEKNRILCEEYYMI